MKYKMGGKVNKPEPVKPFTKGPQGPRRYPGQNEAEQRRRQEAMDEKMRGAYERFERSSENDSPGYKKGGKVKKYSGGGSASKRADGIAQRGKTKGRMV